MDFLSQLSIQPRHQMRPKEASDMRSLKRSDVSSLKCFGPKARILNCTLFQLLDTTRQTHVKVLEDRLFGSPCCDAEIPP